MKRVFWIALLSVGLNAGCAARRAGNLADIDVNADDIAQGTTTGDCWLIATLIAIAQNQPQVIEDMFTLARDGNIQITLVDKNGMLRTVVAQAPPSGDITVGHTLNPNEWNWVGALENAAVSVGWSIGAGEVAHAMQLLGIVNWQATWAPFDSGVEVTLKAANMQPTVACTDGVPITDQGVVGEHCYAVEGAGDGYVTLLNPWRAGEVESNGDIVTLTYAQFSANFGSLYQVQGNGP